MAMHKANLSEAEPDFDLKALAKRLSIASLMSSDSDQSEGNDQRESLAYAGRSLSTSSDTSSGANALSTAPTSFTDSLADADLEEQDRPTWKLDQTPLANNASHFMPVSELGTAASEWTMDDCVGQDSETARRSSGQKSPHTGSRRTSRDLQRASISLKDKVRSDPMLSQRSPSQSASFATAYEMDSERQTPRARPHLRGTKTFAGSPSQSRPTSMHSPTQSIVLSQEELTNIKRRSLRGASEIDRLDETIPFTSPRLGSTRSPILHSRPSLSKSGSSFVVSSSRPGSISRKLSYSRSSRANSLVGAPASITRRHSNRSNAISIHSERDKTKALALTASEFLDVLKQQHERSAAAGGASQSPTTSEYTASSCVPLVIDVRPLPVFLGSQKRIKGSINANFPSLLVKRFKKGKIANFALESFITTEIGKRTFKEALERSTATAMPVLAEDSDAQSTTAKALADLDLFVVDERIQEHDGSSVGSILLSVFEQILDGHIGTGSLCFLRGSFKDLESVKDSEKWLVEEEDAIDTPTVHLPRSSSLVAPVHPPAGQQPHEGLRQLHISTSNAPAHSSQSSPRSDSGREKRHQLRRIDTSERLQTAHQQSPFKQTNTIRSPAPLNLTSSRQYSDSPLSTPSNRSRPESAMSLQELCHVQSKAPSKPNILEGDDDIRRNQGRELGADRDGDEAEEFIVSEIIPDFLYLGPEPCTREHVQQLLDIGVKQILNMALEIDDNQNLQMRSKFEKYARLPMRDFFEETGVQQTIDEACNILDDAELKSRPIFVHCRAGKSRSVTMVLAYLIHRYHWPLKRAYAYVAERRKGISPNIGFISELMRYEERSLGVKSNGVSHASVPSDTSSHVPSRTPSVPMSAYTSRNLDVGVEYPPATAQAGIGYARMRESLPPSMGTVPSHFGFEGMPSMGSEQEVKGYNGTWVKARQEQMERFRPIRRISKAGLESNP